MTLKRKLAVLNAAEALCQQQRQEADRALAHLKSELRRTATPARIVVSGLAVGFAAGLRKPGGDSGSGSSLLTGPLFSMVIDSVLPGVLAGITAAVTGAVEGQDDGEPPNQDEDEVVTEEPEPPLPDPVAQPAAKPRSRKKRHVDSAA